MILSLKLHANANLVVAEYISIVLRIACCAPFVIASASSKMIILHLPAGKVTFFCANILILFLTTSIPLSSDAFNSNTASLYRSPSNVRAKTCTEVVFPHPGGPDNNKFGIEPVSIIPRIWCSVSSWPTMSSNFVGRHFSIHGWFAVSCSRVSFCFSLARWKNGLFMLLLLLLVRS